MRLLEIYTNLKNIGLYKKIELDYIANKIIIMIDDNQDSIYLDNNKFNIEYEDLIDELETEIAELNDRIDELEKENDRLKFDIKE